LWITLEVGGWGKLLSLPEFTKDLSSTQKPLGDGLQVTKKAQSFMMPTGGIVLKAGRMVGATTQRVHPPLLRFAFLLTYRHSGTPLRNPKKL
jgi:hypothetical protein